MSKLALDNQGIHNFSDGCLDAYFKINTEKQVKLDDGILIIESSKPKVFVFQYKESQLQFLQERQRKGVIYSIIPLPLKKESKFTEVCYALEEVFDPTSYENAKKRYKYLKYPALWCTKENITWAPINHDNIKSVIKLHDEWCKHKLDDEKTYRMMFPTGRYKRCCEYALGETNIHVAPIFDLHKEKFVSPDYYSYVFSKNNEVVACRILSFKDRVAYDLAFFCNTWTEGLSQLSNYVQMICLQDLYNKRILTVNCGSSLNSYLKSFKQHLPSFILQHFMYGRINV